jgi:hypothetical protein
VGETIIEDQWVEVNLQGKKMKNLKIFFKKKKRNPHLAIPEDRIPLQPI